MSPPSHGHLPAYALPEYGVKRTPIQSQNLTTLAMSNHYDQDLSNGQIIEVLKAVPNLEHFHWEGTLGIDSHLSPQLTDDPVVLGRLLSITTEDSNLELCRLLSRVILCPKLETLRILVCKPRDYIPDVVREALSSIKAVLRAAPLIKNVTVVQCEMLWWSLGIMEASTDPSQLKYVIYSGTQAQFVEALQQDEYWAEVSPDSPLERLPAEIMIVESTAKLLEHGPPDRIHLLAAPRKSLPGRPDRTLDNRGEERLTDAFDFVDFIVNDWPRGRTSSSIENPQLAETWKRLGCLYDDLGFLVQLMEMVRSEQFPSDTCSFTFAAVLTNVDVYRRVANPYFTFIPSYPD
ncbi:hypothetical protein H1R20_g6216, partial [Candolleomyces eurysporus]